MEKKTDLYGIVKLIIEYLAIILFIAILVLQSYNIFSRFTRIGSPFMWVEALSRYSFILIVFFVWVLVDKENAHYTVDIIPSKLSGKKKTALEFFTEFIKLIFAALVIWSAITYIPPAMAYTSTSFPTIPKGVFYLVIPIGFVMLAAQKIASFISYFTKKDR